MFAAARKYEQMQLSETSASTGPMNLQVQNKLETQESEEAEPDVVVEATAVVDEQMPWQNTHCSKIVEAPDSDDEKSAHSTSRAGSSDQNHGDNYKEGYRNGYKAAMSLVYKSVAKELKRPVPVPSTVDDEDVEEFSDSSSNGAEEDRSIDSPDLTTDQPHFWMDDMEDDSRRVPNRFSEIQGAQGRITMVVPEDPALGNIVGTEYVPTKTQDVKHGPGAAGHQGKRQASSRLIPMAPKRHKKRILNIPEGSGGSSINLSGGTRKMWLTWEQETGIKFYKLRGMYIQGELHIHGRKAISKPRSPVCQSCLKDNKECLVLDHNTMDPLMKSVCCGWCVRQNRGCFD